MVACWLVTGGLVNTMVLLVSEFRRVSSQCHCKKSVLKIYWLEILKTNTLYITYSNEDVPKQGFLVEDYTTVKNSANLKTQSNYHLLVYSSEITDF